MRIRLSYLMAVAVLGGVGLYMTTGEVRLGGADAGIELKTISERVGEAAERPFAVRVARFVREERQAAIEVRGRTEADARVGVRAETGGVVTGRPAAKGDRVAPGDLLCVLDRGTREARLLQAEAALAQAESDHRAAEQLAAKEFTPRSRVTALKAQLDAARAALAEAETELARTEVRAGIGGIVESPLAEVGDMLSPGAVCATVVNPDPMLVVGQVSERQIGMLSVGMTAKVAFVTGESAEGTVRYIAPSADPQTRTFRVEIAIANPDGRIRDGVTAVGRIDLPATPAHRLPASALILDDDGRIGVRTVDGDSRAAFLPVTVLADGAEGVWVGGLPEEVTIITVGQDYVGTGQPVEALAAPVEEAAR